MKLGLERIRDATLMIGKWSGLTATFAGIFSLGGLWGMGQIGRTVGERRTSAMGNKVTYGEQEAFGTYFSRLGGVSLEGIREGLQDPRSEAATGLQSLLGAGGLREETARGDPAETFKKLAPLIRQKFMPQKGKQLNKQMLDAYHLEALGFSDEVVQALVNMEPGELEQLLKGYESGKTAFNLSEADQKKWTEFNTTLDEAGGVISTAFKRQLIKFKPQVEELTNLFAGVAEAFVRKGGPAEVLIRGLDKGLRHLSTTIKGSEFKSYVKLFVADLQRLEELVHAYMHGGFYEVLGVFKRQVQQYQGGGDVAQPPVGRIEGPFDRQSRGGGPKISKTPERALPPGQTRLGGGPAHGLTRTPGQPLVVPPHKRTPYGHMKGSGAAVETSPGGDMQPGPGVHIPAEGTFMSPFLAPRGGHRSHAGIDISGPRGSPIYATEGGEVIRNQWQSGYGWTVDIKSGDKVFRYAHLDEQPNVRVGQHVQGGQQFGKMGASGTRNPNTGFHLHTEVRTWESYQRDPFSRPDAYGRHDPGILDPAQFYHLGPRWSHVRRGLIGGGNAAAGPSEGAPIGEGGVQILRGFGSTKPDATNNPGDIHFGSWIREHPEFGGTVSGRTDQGVPLIQFPSLAKGFAAMRALVLAKYHNDKHSLNELIAGQGGWTPGNYIAAKNIADFMGVKPDEDLRLHDADRMRRFQNALARREGSRARLGSPLRHGHPPAGHYQHESGLHIHDNSGGLVTIAT
jgi:murein DD-endopeptidase MepM/ murein hydrolase activator NlpD